MAANGNASYHSLDSPPSPVSPSASFASAPRSFVSAIRGQNSPFPTTPTSSMNPFFDPPAGTPYADFIRTWTDSHVARWLSDIKCSNHAATFRANDIRGDILLELDQTTLQEMGVSSIGDRLRIINAVKALRQRSAARGSATPILDTIRPLRLDVSMDASTIPKDKSGRPAPLQLNNTSSNRNDLPRLVREHQPPDSARLNATHNPVRPLPQPSQLSAQSSSGSIQTASSTRSNLPPLPPPPRSQPPLPPPGRAPARGMLNGGSQLSGRRTPDMSSSYSSQPLPPAPPQQPLLTPSSASNWSGYHLPADPRPGNPGGGKPPAPPASTDATALWGTTSPGSSSSPSGKGPLRSNTGSGHPYSSAQSSLQAPTTSLAYNLSPIEESFSQQSGSPAATPSPPSYSVGHGPFKPSTPSTHGPAPSLDDLRRKLVRFLLPDEGLSFTIDVTSCAGGIEVLEKVLKKFGKGGSRSAGVDGGMDVQQTPEGGLSVDGWGVYLDWGQDDGPGEPLQEAELLSVCHAPPDHPAREHGLTLRRTNKTRPLRRPQPGQLVARARQATKRASSISILSGLGVHDPERALDPPSPTASEVERNNPTLLAPPQRPSKLHNFFGQRPPSELITDHLTEFFPLTDKKVLARTARQSMIFRANTRSKRDSTASWNPNPSLPSRFSSSTQGSAKRMSMSSARTVPRVSLSTEDGESIDLHDSPEAPKLAEHPQLLPPIPFPTESFSESLEDITGDNRRVSRNLSVGSRRMSYMTELRSKRDRTDTASMLTVDEITADLATERPEDEWTKVDTQDGLESDNPENTLMDDEDAEEDLDLADEDVDEEGTLNDPDADEEPGKPQTHKGMPSCSATKWIKGALIGAGSFGKVYLGMDASTGLLMAVKQVELPTGSAPNQERKKSMLSALDTENIVQYLYSSLEDEFLNIFLEYVPGGSVTALLRNYGAFEEPLVKNFVRQILEGLSYLHERNIIHRDIKGANILVDNKGGIKISDFGISKKVDNNLLAGSRAHRASLQGSVFWMAPEVVKQSGHTRKADIWSMLTGEHPWSTLTQMQAIFKVDDSLDISSDAQDFLQRTFELDTEARPSAQELLQHAWVSKKPAVSSKKAAAKAD
ncbi:ste11-like protein [Mycena rebaudengoi]|nr:ste11-like protein [Mycena rebaudengoi]